LQNYIGKTVAFPVNPTEGYIYGSTYLRVAHNPLDISEIKFVKVENEILTVELIMTFVLNLKGLYLKMSN
jgi:hypothetical protein